MTDFDTLAASFRRFAEVEVPSGDCPLYETLALAVAADRDLLGIASHRMEGQPIANMLFGAVHYLLAKAPNEALATHYRTLSSGPPVGSLVALFREFCLSHREAIVRIVETRMVQTNEVRRSACLLPAFGEVANRAGSPLTLIEIGPSAGLNLVFDRYGYDYGNGIVAGVPESAVRINSDSRGAPPPVSPLPRVAARLGIDLNPLDVGDSDEMDWLRALVWPDHTDRMALLNAAIEVARDDPPVLIGGDLFELLPALIEEADPDSAVCVFATFVLNQFSEEMRERLRQLLLASAKRREVSIVVMGFSEFVSMQFEQPFEGSMWLAQLGPRGNSATRLAGCHHHGRWIDWAPEEFELQW